MATGKNNQTPDNTESCPQQDGFFDDRPPSLVPTEDGSPTLLSVTGETYHSLSGAVLESQHIYVETGFRFLSDRMRKSGQYPKTIHLLEMGFGTGLNALLTYRAWMSERKGPAPEILYETFEAFPLHETIWNALHYDSSPDEKEFFVHMHQGPWGEPFQAAAGFTLIKRKEDFTAGFLPANIHLVYYDAFSPAVQPELWTKEVLGRITPFLETNAVLVTYSSRGEVKRHLLELGFMIERLPGPGKKRHILRAVYRPDTCLMTGVSSASIRK